MSANSATFTASATSATDAQSCNKVPFMCSSDPEIIKLYEKMNNDPIFEDCERPVKINKKEQRPVKINKKEQTSEEKNEFLQHLPFFNESIEYEQKIYYNKFCDYEKSYKKITKKYKRYDGIKEPNIYEIINEYDEQEEGYILSEIENINTFYFKNNYKKSDLYLLKICMYGIFNWLHIKYSILGLNKYDFNISGSFVICQILGEEKKDDEDYTYILIHQVYKYMPSDCIPGHKSIYFYDEDKIINENSIYLLCKVKTSDIRQKDLYIDIIKDEENENYNNCGVYSFKYFSVKNEITHNIYNINKNHIFIKTFGLHFSYTYKTRDYRNAYNYLIQINSFIKCYISYIRMIENILDNIEIRDKFVLTYKDIKKMTNYFNEMNNIHTSIIYLSRIFNDKQTIYYDYKIYKYYELLEKIEQLYYIIQHIKKIQEKENIKFGVPEDKIFNAYENKIIINQFLYNKMLKIFNLKIDDNTSYYDFFLTKS